MKNYINKLERGIRMLQLWESQAMLLQRVGNPRNSRQPKRMTYSKEVISS
jgi:hypothetical protein